MKRGRERERGKRGEMRSFFKNLMLPSGFVPQHYPPRLCKAHLILVSFPHCVFWKISRSFRSLNSFLSASISLRGSLLRSQFRSYVGNKFRQREGEQGLCTVFELRALIYARFERHCKSCRFDGMVLIFRQFIGLLLLCMPRINAF